MIAAAGLNLHPLALLALVNIALLGAATYRLLLRWEVQLSLIALTILLVPLGRYELPGNLPFHLEPYRLIVALIYAARRRVVLTTPYFIPDEPMLQALQTASVRGVEVHLIVSLKADQLLVGLAQRSYYEDLLNTGIKVHLYRERFLHAKHMTIDDEISVIGSSNMDMRSFTLDLEISVMVRGREFLDQLRAIEDGYRSHCRELTLDEWLTRPVGTRVLDNIARLTAAVQ